MGKALFASTAAALWVLGVAAASQASMSSPRALEVEHYKGIPYVSGGFGIEERQAIATMGRNDNLELSFALQNKEYLGGAQVLIKDDKGHTVLETASDGPLFFTKLPEGKYTVTATTLGRTLTRDVEVPNKGQARLYFTWKEPSASAAATLAKK